MKKNIFKILLITVSMIFGIFILIIIIGSTVAKGTPSLDKIKSPTDINPITISGKTSFQNAKINLYFNDDPARETNADNSGKFQFVNIQLSEGTNKFKVSATSKEGKTKTAQGKVVYNPNLNKSTTTSIMKTNNESSANTWKEPVKEKFNNAIGKYEKVYADFQNALPSSQPPANNIYQRINDVNKSGTIDYTWSQFRQQNNIALIMFGTESIDQNIRKNMPADKDNQYNNVALKIDDIQIALMNLEDICTKWLIGNASNNEKNDAQKKVDQSIKDAKIEVENFLK